MKTTKHLLLIAFLLCFTTTIKSAEHSIPNNEIHYISDGDIVTPYSTDGFGANIISNTCEDGQGVITFDGAVTSIGSSAFYDCISLYEISIPDGVTSIGDHAFASCSSLNYITIPSTVTTIGDEAFYNTGLIDDFVIPGNVKTIGAGAFRGCSDLTSVILQEGILTIGEYAFAECEFLESIQFPNTATSIDNFACMDCPSLWWVCIGENLSNMPNNVFAGCDNLQEIEWNVAEGDLMTPFAGNTSITTIIFGYEVTTLPMGFCENMTSLSSVTFGGRFNWKTNMTSIPEFMFSGCTSLTNITIPNTVTTIAAYAFSNSGLTDIVIPEKVTSIGVDAFASCENLSFVTFNEGLLLIGANAFYNCGNIESIILPNSLTTVQSSAFQDCSSLNSLTLSENLTYIGANAFEGCEVLDSIISYAITPPVLESENTFHNYNATLSVPCESLADYQAHEVWGMFNNIQCTESVSNNKIFYTSTDGNIVTPYSTDGFGANIISNTYKNGQGVITFDGPVTSIGSEAFSGCFSLTSIVIPESITTIEASAFHSCYELTSVLLPENLTNIDFATFAYCKKLPKITIPRNVTNIGPSAFYDCYVLDSLTIPENVTSIGEQAFYNCSSLKTIIWNAYKYENTIEKSPLYDIVNTLRTIIFGDNMTHIPNHMCYNLQQLNKIILPIGLESIGYMAFSGSNITSIVIPESVHTIGASAFHSCYELTSISLPENLTNIDFATFAYCKKLPKITIPRNVTNIGPSAFYGCYVLDSLTIPENVTSIGEQAFYSCSSLTSMYANPIVPPSLGTSAFNGHLNAVYVPCGSANAYRSSSWNTYCTNFIEPEVLYSVNLHSADTIQGQVAFDQDPSCDNTAIIRAIPSLGHRFTAWNDAVTTNPRTLLLSQDTTFTANFELMLLDAEYATICYGESYTWNKNGQTYTEAGTYTTIMSEGEATLHLTIRPEVPITNDSATICQGETYTWNGQTYSTEGEYTVTLQDINGCDSVAVLHLVVNPIPTTEETIIACGSYTWNDSTYTQSGDYAYTTTAANGCDSIVTLHLTINQRQYAEEIVTACDSYTWNGETYTTSGDYIYTTTAANGCDSIVTLHLTIHYSEIGETEYATICYGETYTWNGQTYSTAGEYSITLSNTLGCDSAATLHLTIMPEAVSTTETVVIGSNELPYIWREQSITATGRYTDIEQYTTAVCDSAIHVLDLTVLTTGAIDEQSATICDTEAPYVWYEQSLTTSGKYTHIEKYAGTDIDSIQHILNLTVNPTLYTEYTATACDTYTWNNETYNTSGDYTQTFTAITGCDSIVTLHLTINQTQYAEETVTACDSYTWNGETYTTSGDYIYTTTAANGCDSIVTLHLTVHYSEEGATEYATICHGETYLWNGQTYSTTGEYSITLSNTLGCDSVATLNLTILPEAVTTTETVVIGSNELPYTWRGQSITATGRYTDIEQYTTAVCDSAIHVLDLTVLTTGAINEQSATICDTEAPYLWYEQSLTTSGKYTHIEKYAGTDIDSIQHILNLTVNPTLYTEYTATACDTYTWNNETYSTSGDYTQTFTAITGCDSIVTLHLTIHYSDTAYFTATACDSYEWHGVVYTQSGVYPYLTQTVHGCDSLELLNLTIHYSDTAYFTATACDSYEWHGVVYTQSGVYPYLTQTVHGCDSLELLNLTVHYSDTAYFTATACDSYEWHGQVYTQSGVYPYLTQTVHSCDSLELLNLTIHYSEISETEYATICYGETYLWNGQTYSTTGEYTLVLSNTLGCDSVATLHLTIMPEAVTTTEAVVIGSNELPYTWRGQSITATGRYTDIEQYTTAACDSAIHVLDITVLTTGAIDEQSATICDTEAPYVWYEQSLTTSGKYTHIEKYAGTDIDSIQHILNLTVNPTVYTEEHITACDSYTWNGQTYTLSGDYTYTTNNINGCDSIVTLHLTINNSEIGAPEFATICYGETYTWHGQTYSTEGEYSVTLSNTLGCDSVATLQLTIMPEATTTTETVVIGSDELPYTWRGNTYSATGQYTVIEQYTTVACDSAIHVLDLTVLTTGNHDEQSVTICETEAPYIWYGESYSATGKYTYTEKYVGTDIDSIQHILNLTVNPTVYTEETITACDSYEWNGQTYTQSGEYVYTTVAANGCDSIVTLHLTIHYSEVGETEYVTICYGETYLWNSQTYSTTGEYSITLSNTLGCDSVATLNLTILPEAITQTETVVIGNDELPYLWRDMEYTTTGLYTNIEKYSIADCDSAIHVLDLTVLNTDNYEENSVTICDTEAPYVWYEQSLTTSGKYTHIEKYAGTDIDSIQHILNLTVNPTVYTEFTATACDTYTWNNETYNTSGDYTQTFTAITGCDSIVTLHLTIHYSDTAYFTATACDSYEWHGVVYTQSGVYPYLTQTVHGCDSLELLTLTIHHGDTAYFTEIACDNYEWHGEVYTQSGVYEYLTQTTHGCDSLEILDLTVHNSEVGEVEYVTICYGETYTWNEDIYSYAGTYGITLSNQFGCDSTATLQLAVMPKPVTRTKTVTIGSNNIPYEWRGNEYTTTGRYIDTEKFTSIDCDSIIYVLELTVMNAGNYDETNITICENELPYQWNNQLLTETGEYSYTEKYANSTIDSMLHILYLTVMPTKYTEEHATICYGETYEWNESVYSQTGNYPLHLESTTGCDSIVTLHLIVLPQIPDTEEFITICHDDAYTWNGLTYTNSGTYTETLSNVNGCDSIAILHLTVLPEAIIVEEHITVHEENLPYIWRNQPFYDMGKHFDSEPFVNFIECDSVIYVLNLKISSLNKCGESIYWHYNNSTLTITGSGAMYDDPDLLSYREEPWYPARVNNIVLPDSLTHIGSVAFADCANLTHIDIPSSVTSIGDGAFSWTGLQSVTIPASVTELGEQVFEACSNLHTIIYEGYPTVISNQAIHPLIGCVHLDTVIAPAALWHCTNADKALEKRYGVPHKARYIEVTDGLLSNQAVKYIAQNATALEVLDLTNTTNTTLPYGAFSHSYLLTQLYLPAYIETLPESMIEGGSRLSEITIPAMVTEIGNYAFAGCVNIWRMTVEAMTPPKVYENTFDGVNRSISVLVPAGSEQAYREAEYWREFFIDNTNSPLPISNCQKILRENHILILREGKVYTTMGQLINTEKE